MASFRETREALLLVYDEDLINDEEFVLLHNLNMSKILIILTGTTADSI